MGIALFLSLCVNACFIFAYIILEKENIEYEKEIKKCKKNLELNKSLLLRGFQETKRLEEENFELNKQIAKMISYKVGEQDVKD